MQEVAMAEHPAGRLPKRLYVIGNNFPTKLQAETDI